MFGFNRQTALLDDESVCWMLDVFDWVLVNFDRRKLQAETKLIYPNNDYFPGKESSVEGMAALIFQVRLNCRWCRTVKNGYLPITRIR